MPTEGRSRIRFGLSLREAALQPERRAVEVVCIRPGLSRNGNYYGEGALREALPLFEGARAYVDHAEGQLRSVRDLAGTYREARLDDDGAVRCTLAVARHQEWLWSLIRESVEEGSDLVGLSVDVSAQCREGEMEGRRCRIVERITALHSVDVITRAAAGASRAWPRPIAAVGGTRGSRRTRRRRRWPAQGWRAGCRLRRSSAQFRRARSRRCNSGRARRNGLRVDRCWREGRT